ncbi:MAG: tyrosine-type recombinase/integrase [Gaiellales bacterium]
MERRKLRRHFTSRTEAVAWREERRTAQRRGEQLIPAMVTLWQLSERLVEGMRSGAVRTRSGDHYKPSVIRGYHQAMQTHVLPALGGVRLGDLRRKHLQQLVEELHRDGLNPSTIRNALLPVRVICRRAIRDGDVTVNPTLGLELPAYRGKRDRIAAPTEAAALVDALPVGDRALWATALYAGLRRGELQALQLEDVHLDLGVICVQHGWDQKEGLLVDPKSRAGRRTVPITPLLYDLLAAHRLTLDRQSGLIFGRTPTTAFNPSTITARSKRTWLAAGLQPITLHDARHTFASLMIAAGLNTKALSVYMGHASVVITLDRYGHLLPGSEAQAAAVLDTYLKHARAEEPRSDPPAGAVSVETDAPIKHHATSRPTTATRKRPSNTATETRQRA